MMSSNEESAMCLFFDGGSEIRKKNRKYSIHSLIIDRQHSSLIFARELYNDPVKFKEFFRMSNPPFGHNVEVSWPKNNEEEHQLEDTGETTRDNGCNMDLFPTIEHARS